MKTTRTIDEITTEVKIGCTDAMGGVHKVYIPLTEEAKAELLATILASMPEKNGTDTHEQDKGWNACLTQVEQELNKLFSHD